MTFSLLCIFFPNHPPSSISRKLFVASFLTWTLLTNLPCTQKATTTVYSEDEVTSGQGPAAFRS